MLSSYLAAALSLNFPLLGERTPDAKPMNPLIPVRVLQSCGYMGVSH